ncbi:MAG: three-Cys-motif partner protein TcmP [Chloroflexota bacterium]|nr:three-Cys-motif partner protein TcmP [Chloroflexota bacterium]
MLGKRGTGKHDEIGPWSLDKLTLLQKYLDAYAHIMGSQEWCRAYHYIDAFAGSVYPTLKSNIPATQERFPIASEQEQYILGSSKRALLTTPPFTVCWFVELESQRLSRLRELQSDFPDRDIRIRDTDCNQVLRTEIVPLITKQSAQRAVVFLDPYGLQVEWATVQALATAGTFDIFVNLSLMGITRLLKRDSPPDPPTMELLNRMMGNTSWVAKLYERTPESSVLPMFPDEPLAST